MNTPIDISGASILVVDDQLANVKLLELVLKDAGYRCVTATMDPQEVCGLHAANRYDLILLDLNMPLMDGFAVMEGLKVLESGDYLPVIVLTAEPSHKMRALQAGARDFIAKPLHMGELMTRMRNMLEVRLLYRQMEQYNERLEAEVQERTAKLLANEARFKELAALASDWYWEQNAAGDSATVSGPVAEILGLRVTAFFGAQSDSLHNGWVDADREALQSRIAAREPFRDLAFRRVNADGSRQQFKVSGEPMLDNALRFIGFRGIGVETKGNGLAS